MRSTYFHGEGNEVSTNHRRRELKEFYAKIPKQNPWRETIGFFRNRERRSMSVVLFLYSNSLDSKKKNSRKEKHREFQWPKQIPILLHKSNKSYLDLETNGQIWFSIFSHNTTISHHNYLPNLYKSEYIFWNLLVSKLNVHPTEK